MKHKHSKYKTIDIGEAAGKLCDLAWRIRGMAYLIECRGDEPAPPLDEGQIYFGIGSILSDLSQRVYRVARAMDEHQVAQAMAAKRNGAGKDDEP